MLILIFCQIKSDGYFNCPFYSVPFGTPTYSLAGYMGMMAATISSIFESVGDYFVAARLSEVSSPPPHAINRGIAIEGLSSIISGLMGPGHATTSYSNNIGIIGITKVCIVKQVGFICAF
jgi:nucleobase transporter 1/2